jgi:hypothetical protein
MAIKSKLAALSARVDAALLPLAEIRESRLYSVHLREVMVGTEADETFFVEGIDLLDAAERATAIAAAKTGADQKWEAAQVQYAGQVRRLWHRGQR